MTVPAPTDEQRDEVMMMAACGIPIETIARIMRLSHTTLYKYYRDELENGATRANVKVAGSLFRKATSDSLGSVTAAIFWLKTRCGWKEPPVTIDQTLQLLGKKASEMTDDELVALIARATFQLESAKRDQEQSDELLQIGRL
jgi:Helix-turn-helix domain of resolvase